MTDMDRILESIKDELKNQQEMAEKAKNAQKDADRLKREAKLTEESTKKRIAELEEAAKKAEEAKVAYNAVATSYGVSTNNEEVEFENKSEEITYSNNSKSTKSNLKSFAAGALAVALIGTGAWALSKDSKTGRVRVATWFNNPKTVSDDQVSQETETENNNYEYNYNENVVTVTKTTTTDLGNTVVTTVETENYETLTTEKFEELCSKIIAKYEGLGLAIEREDIVKYVAMFNIDKLKQDNPELVRTIIGTQKIEEVMDDAEEVMFTLMSYEAQNYIYNGQIFPLADCKFDETQRRLVESFEARKLAIVQANAGDRETMLVQLFDDMVSATSSYRLLEDSSKFLVLNTCIGVIDSTYFKDATFHSTLTGAARSYMFQYIAPYGASDEEIKSSVISAAEREMMYSFRECNEVKTLTK